MFDRLCIRYNVEATIYIRPPLPADIERGAAWKVRSGAFQIAMTWAEVCALIRTLEEGGWLVRPTPETRTNAYPAYTCTHPPVAYPDPVASDDDTRERAEVIEDPASAEA